MENIGKITVFALFLVMASLVSLLGAHVILKIAILYDLKFVLQFSFVQVYGIMCVFSVLKYQYKDNKNSSKSSSFKKGISKGFETILSYAFFYLISWFFAYLMYLVIS